MSKHIESIRIRHMIDESPDTSYIGEYSDDPSPAGTIDRKARGDQERNTYRYFNPANPEYAEQDYDRMESLNRGGWYYLGIRAEAEIIMNNTIQRIASGGLWGIESDSGREYLEEVAAEELASLKDQLAELGFTDEEINEAFDDCETVDN